MRPAAIGDNLRLLQGLKDKTGFKLAYDPSTELFSVQNYLVGIQRAIGNLQNPFGKAKPEDKQSVGSDKNFLEPMQAVFFDDPPPGITMRIKVEALRGLEALLRSYAGADRDKVRGLDELIARSWVRLSPPLSDDLTRFLDQVTADQALMNNLSAVRDGGHGIEADSLLDQAIYGKYCFRDKNPGAWPALGHPPEQAPREWVDDLWESVRDNLEMPGGRIAPYTQGDRDQLLSNHQTWPLGQYQYGFMWFRLEGEPESDFRVYLHPKLKRDPMAVFIVAGMLLDFKRHNRLMFFKVAGPMKIRARNDRIVVYCADRAQATRLAQDLSKLGVNFFGKRVPPMTALPYPQDTIGIGMGEEPGADGDLVGRSRSSFGSLRAKAIANAIVEYRRDNTQGRGIFNCLVAQELLRLNVDPGSPFSNLA